MELLPKHPLDITLQVVSNKIIYSEFGCIGGCRYDGQVDKNGNRKGYGRLQWIGHHIWEGHWSKYGDILNGRGIYSTGHYYIGATKDGFAHGYGTDYMYYDGSIKQGQWENGNYKGK